MNTTPPTLPDTELDDLFREWEETGQLPEGVRDAGRRDGRPYLVVAIDKPGSGDNDEECERTPEPIDGRRWHQVPPLRGNLKTSSSPV